MKKIIYLLSITTLLFASCVKGEDDLFDAPSSQRVEKAAVEYQQILRSAEHGWIMEYYPEAKQKYGGYIFTMKFNEDNRVLVSSEITNDAKKVKESLYSIKKDISLTLNFDSYNEIFHYLTDPDPHNPGKRSHFGFKEKLESGKGYEGDYEFVFRQVSDNQITLKGKKTNNIIRMTKLTETPESYIAKSMKVGTEVIFSGCKGYTAAIGGKEAWIVFEKEKVRRRLTIQYDGKEETTGFHYTATGLRFYQPIEVGGKKMQEFTWNKDGKTLTEVNSPDLVFTGVIDPDYIKYTAWFGKWTFKYTDQDKKEKEVGVELKEDVGLASYKMEGLPFPAILTYNKDKDMLEMRAQQVIPDVWLVVYYVKVGRLARGRDLGFNLELVADSNPKQYKFVDNGKWMYQTDGFNLVNSSWRDYKTYGVWEFFDMSLTRSN